MPDGNIEETCGFLSIFCLQLYLKLPLTLKRLYCLRFNLPVKPYQLFCLFVVAVPLLVIRRVSFAKLKMTVLSLESN